MAVSDVHLLRRLPLFSLLDEAEAAELAAQLDQVRIWDGQLVFSHGDPGGKMYAVVSGSIEIFIKDAANQKCVLEVVEPGGLFGELSLLDEAPRSASARAVENSLLLAIDRHDLQVLFGKHPDAALDIMATLSRRIRETDVLLTERVVSRNPNEMLTQRRTLSTRLADLFSAIAGDMRFVYFCFAWFAIWIVWNLGFVPGLPPFDPFPFGLLTMIVSLLAIFLSTFVLISQNLTSERDKVRNDIEYEVNVKAELEIRELRQEVAEMQQLLLRHFDRVYTNIDRIQTSGASGMRDMD